MILYYFYLGLLYLFFPIFLLRTYLRQRLYPQNQGRLKERLGFFNVPKLNHPIWIHAVSYGEAVLAEQLVKAIRIRFPQWDIVVTTTTFTGSERIRKTLGEAVFHVYLPYDLPSFVRRFIKKINPRMLIVLETELWPTLLKQSHQAGIPIFLGNARLSEKSAKHYHYILPLVRWMLNQIDLVAAQSELDGRRFLQLGLDPKKLAVMGSIKYDLQISQGVREEGNKLRKALGEDRFVWIAASTHQGEEEKILEAFEGLRTVYTNALLILVPRHPERFDEVAHLCEQGGYCFARRSTLDLPVKMDVLLGDTLGELLMFYAASDVAFVGGSFVPVGGHNVLEPLAVGIPTFIGSYFHNFTEIVTYLEKRKAIQIVDAPEVLARQMVLLIQNGEERREQIERGKRALEENRGALNKHLDEIAKLSEEKT